MLFFDLVSSSPTCLSSFVDKPTAPSALLFFKRSNAIKTLSQLRNESIVNRNRLRFRVRHLPVFPPSTHLVYALDIGHQITCFVAMHTSMLRSRILFYRTCEHLPFRPVSQALHISHIGLLHFCRQMRLASLFSCSQ